MTQAVHPPERRVAGREHKKSAQGTVARRGSDTRNYTSMRTTAFLLMTLVAIDAWAQQKPTTGYAPVNGLNMYYEVHGDGEPVVLLHGRVTAGGLRAAA